MKYPRFPTGMIVLVSPPHVSERLAEVIDHYEGESHDRKVRFVDGSVEDINEAYLTPVHSEVVEMFKQNAALRARVVELEAVLKSISVCRTIQAIDGIVEQALKGNGE